MSLSVSESTVQQQTHIINAVDMIRKATQMDPTQPKYWDELAIALHKYALPPVSARAKPVVGIRGTIAVPSIWYTISFALI